MERIISLNEQIFLLKKVQGTNYVHRVPEERDGEITFYHLRKLSGKE